MPHVFISYVRENEAVINRLCAELRQRGVVVWRDREQIQPGQRWQQVIRQAIQQGACFLACFSDEYSARESTYMNEELTLAIDELRKRPTNRTWFIPVLLSNCEVPDRDIGGGETIRHLQWVSVWDDWDNGVVRIVSAVKPPVPDAAQEPTLRVAGRVQLHNVPAEPPDTIPESNDPVTTAPPSTKIFDPVSSIAAGPKASAPLVQPHFGPSLADFGLSEQAVFILGQFVESGDDQFVYANWGGGVWSLQCCHGEQKQLSVTEPRFIQEDLNELVARRLLTVEYNTDGHGIYQITRKAAQLIRSLPPARD